MSNNWLNLRKTPAELGIEEELKIINQELFRRFDTQREISIALGISQQYCSAILNGRKRLTVSTLKKIDKVLNVGHGPPLEERMRILFLYTVVDWDRYAA